MIINNTIPRDSESYPQNLLDAIAAANQNDDNAVWEYFIPADLLGTIEYVLHTFISTREAGILRLRFQRKETLEKIAEIHCISRERVRVVVENALKRLCSPESFNYLRYGIYKATQKEIDSAIEKVRMSELASAVAYIQKLCIDKNYADKNPLVVTAETSIEELELSVRCFNCLKRARINKVGDLEKITLRDFQRIRNFGAATRNEFIEKLASYGVSFQKGTDADERIVLQKAPVIIG